MSAPHRLALPAVAVLLGLTACGSTASSAPASASAPSPTPISSAPVSPAPAPTTKAPSPSATRDSLGPEHGSGVCPPAKEFEKLVDLPEGWHFARVKCWKSWATTEPEGPNKGDGIYLFRYASDAGWRYHSQGSGYFCKDLGIHEPAPFCQYP
ncbi:hypothetical protein OWR29_00045 [Actinoplanes sp. Pm04-4]|uniref:Uncharacterized protein n=1 Tax=Paractinoplanes pyxinae TaxID=2997416 RepID=A0ABT4AQ54_9ACTN|nr:hypothetical protein [Actinoplanes pyxinae]MCY1136370.1 hypothetical protein [Actinoplanes pyxinae]